MRGPLVVAVAQPRTVTGDVAANARAHAAAIEGAAARVVVFPEHSLTGYDASIPIVDPDDACLAPIVAACRATGAIALAGAPVRGDDGREHIATLAIDGDGVRVAYRKMWLGAVEAERFAPGTEPVVLEVDGWRLGLAICRDTGIARHAAETAALGIDAYVAGVVHGADEADLHAERARRVAADHGTWTATASFAGPTGGGYERTAGRSGIWAPDGTTLAEAGPEPGAVVRASFAAPPEEWSPTAPAGTTRR